MLSFFPRDVLDEIWDLIESVSEGFPTYFYTACPKLSVPKNSRDRSVLDLRLFFSKLKAKLKPNLKCFFMLTM